jgi:hypothetical protein
VTTAGEAWTRDQLERLRARRFRPAAVVAFLVASQRRAHEVRRARPQVARREAAWAAIGFAGWLGLAAAGVEPFRARLRPGLAGWAATVVMLDWHLGMLETPAGHPRNLGPADAATLLRAWLVPAVAHRPSPALCAAGLASDVLDGRLARATAPTRLGRDLEGLVDVAFAAAVLRGSWRRGWLGRRVAVAEAVRLGAGVTYATMSYLGRARPPDAGTLHAARVVTPLRAAGLLLAAAGRRRGAEALLLAGAGTSVALGARATARARS